MPQKQQLDKYYLKITSESETSQDFGKGIALVHNGGRF